MNFLEIQDRLLRKKEEKGILVAAHRGTFGGGIVQNTILSYKNALLHGADIIEVDVAKSADGVLYTHHFGTEKQVFDRAIDIRQMQAKEIDTLISMNAIGMPMEGSLCRLDDVLEEFKGKCYINIDHAWFNWELIIRTLKRHSMQEQIIIKSHVDDKLSASYKELGGDMMYMPILKDEKDFIGELKRVEAYDLPIVAAEILMMNRQAVDNVPALLDYLHKNRYLAWVNTLTMTEKIPLALLEQIPEQMKNSPEVKGMLEMAAAGLRGSFCYGLDDNTAIDQGPEHVYGRLIDMGFDVLQTDWPALVCSYVKSRNQ